MPDRMLSIPELMEFTGCGRMTLYRCMKRGELVPTKIGRRTVFHPDEVRRFCSGRTA